MAVIEKCAMVSGCQANEAARIQNGQHGFGRRINSRGGLPGRLHHALSPPPPPARDPAGVTLRRSFEASAPPVGASSRSASGSKSGSGSCNRVSAAASSTTWRMEASSSRLVLARAVRPSTSSRTERWHGAFRHVLMDRIVGEARERAGSRAARWPRHPRSPSACAAAATPSENLRAIFRRSAGPRHSHSA